MARRRRVLLFVAALVAAGLGALAHATDALRSLEEAAIDARFEVRSDDTRPEGVVVLGLDAETYRATDNPPIRRRHHATALDALKEAGARTIAYDLEFSGETSIRDDNALIRALRRTGDVILGTLAGPDFVLGGRRSLQRFARVRIGFAGFEGDRGDVVRRLRGRIEGLPTFAALAAGRSADGVIDYRGDVRVISFARALVGRLPPLDDKVVVVGDVSGLDTLPTPLGTRPGPEVQAAAIDTILRGTPLRALGDGPAYALVIALGLLVPLAALFLAGLRWLPVALAELAAWPVAAQLLFDADRIAPFAPGAVAALAGGIGTLVVAYVTDLGERRRLRAQFARFAPPSVIDALTDRSSLAGVQLDATVLFSDLRGFTSTAEALGAERVIALLDDYLSTMSDAILDRGGTVVSFMGDGIMAVFGAPAEQPDHADRALDAARAMLGPCLEAFNARSGTPFTMGVGLASGPVMSGTVGSVRRIEYATVGDTTNTAARLEAHTKETGHALHVADSTRLALTRPHDLVEGGEVTLRGRTAPTRLWTLPHPQPASRVPGTPEVG